MKANKEKPASHEKQQRQQLGHGKKVAEPCPHTYATNIYQCQSADQNREDHNTVDSSFGLWPKPRHVVDKDISNCGRRTNTRQPQQPSGLQTEKTSEGDSCV